MDNSSILHCFAWSVSSQQILLDSSFFWQFFAWSSWKSLFEQFQFSIQATFVSLNLICPSTCLMSLKSERFELLIDLLKSDVRLSLFPISRFNLSLRRRKYHWPARRAAIPIKDPSCCAQSSRQYSVRCTRMKRVCPSLVRGSKNTEGKGWEQKTHTTIRRVKCTKDTVDPLRKTNANPCLDEMTLHLFECAAIVPRPRWCCHSHQNTQKRQNYDESSVWQRCG